MMAFDSKGLDDYVDVAQRIADFRAQYPHGSLQPADPAKPWEQAVVTGVDKHGNPHNMTMIVYTAAAYRTPDDPRPGIGVAWEPFPGRTPYTLGSELMNAETSAWGRAIIAALASDSKRGVASREEVRNRSHEAHAEEPPRPNGRSHGNPWEQKTPTLGEAIGHEFKRLQVTDRAKRLEYVHAIVGKAVTSPVQLTDDEKRDLVGVLGKCQNAHALDAEAAKRQAARDVEAKQEATP